MKLRKIKIEGFGTHIAREWAPDGRPMCMFFGANERGKTTLARFIEFALYGNEAFTLSGNENIYSPLGTARHGGSLEVECVGETYNVSRFRQSGKNDPADVRDSSDNQLSAATFDSELKHNTGAANFRDVFTFGVDELAPLDGRENELERIFYDTLGGGAITVSPKTAFDRISADRNRLYVFATRAWKDIKIKELLREMKPLENAIDAARSQGDVYRSLAARRESLAGELARIKAESDSVGRELSRASSLLSIRDKFALYTEKKLYLEKNSEATNFPEAGERELDRLNSEIAAAAKDLKDKAGAVDALRNDLARLEIRDGWLSRGNDIASLYRRKPSIEKTIEQLAAERRRHTQMDDKAEAVLRTNLPGWSREKVHAAATGIMESDELEHALSALESALKEHASAAENLKAANADTERARAGLARHETKMKAARETAPCGGASPEDFRRELTSYIETLKQLRVTAAELEKLEIMIRERSRAAAALGQSSAPAASQTRFPAHIPGFALIILGAIAFFITRSPDTIHQSEILGSALAVLGAALVYWGLANRPRRVAAVGQDVISEMSAQVGALDAQSHAHAARKKELEDSAAAALGKLGINSLDEDSAAALLSKLGAWQSQTAQLQDEIKSAEAELFRLGQRVEKIEAEELAPAAEAVKMARDAFARVKASLGFPENLQPETARKVRDIIAGLKEKYSEQESALGGIRALENEISEYGLAVRKLAADLGETVPDNADALRLIENIHAAFKQYDAADNKRIQLTREIQNMGETLGKNEERAAAKKSELARLLNAGGAPGDDALFRSRARLYSQYNAALDKFLKAETALLANRPADIQTDEQFLEKLHELHSTGWEYLSAEIAGLEEKKSAVELQREALIRDENDVNRDIAKILGDDELKNLEQQLEGKKALLFDLTDQWDALSVAAAMMKEIADRDEERRIPHIKKFANELFTRFTGGAFERLNINAAERRIEAKKTGGDFLTVDKLSRSVRHELYLAIRLAQALHLGADPSGAPGRRETMPVIMDDVFVDIDDDRLPRVIKAIHDIFSITKTQIIYFSAHEHIRDAFGKICGAGCIIEI